MPSLKPLIRSSFPGIVIVSLLSAILWAPGIGLLTMTDRILTLSSQARRAGQQASQVRAQTLGRLASALDRERAPLTGAITDVNLTKDGFVEIRIASDPAFGEERVRVLRITRKAAGHLAESLGGMTNLAPGACSAPLF